MLYIKRKSYCFTTVTYWCFQFLNSKFEKRYGLNSKFWRKLFYSIHFTPTISMWVQRKLPNIGKTCRFIKAIRQRMKRRKYILALFRLVFAAISSTLLEHRNLRSTNNSALTLPIRYTVRMTTFSCDNHVKTNWQDNVQYSIQTAQY